ncbi:DUF2523 family protein [Telmatospirillum siberiense]|uniref:DUF2523 domain-containing protein n=1 Tax=Telmatospirillum siberiense TaxID=382514 RepID=A0A2N3PS24_9PROT|nr:DUF2523 family protein [Telmatospirillum siberiense]PKU23195.1 DUF2523 domain-containing protein [Telmatospirillum siberiense]
MFGIVLSALNSVLAWLVRSVLVKFAVYFALYFVVSDILAILTPLLPTASSLGGAFAGIGSGVWYFLDVFQFSVGLPAVLSAAGLRFIIRRLPVVG